VKQETLNIIRHDLNIEKKKQESRSINKDFVYEIEYIPVLMERDKKGNIQQIIKADTRLIFENENI